MKRGVIISKVFYRLKIDNVKKRHTLCFLEKECWFRQHILTVKFYIKLQRCTCMAENNYIIIQFAQYHSGIYSEYRREIKVHANHKRIIEKNNWKILNNSCITLTTDHEIWHVIHLTCTKWHTNRHYRLHVHKTTSIPFSSSRQHHFINTLIWNTNLINI